MHLQKRLPSAPVMASKQKGEILQIALKIRGSSVFPSNSSKWFTTKISVSSCQAIWESKVSQRGYMCEALMQCEAPRQESRDRAVILLPRWAYICQWQDCTVWCRTKLIVCAPSLAVSLYKHRWHHLLENDCAEVSRALLCCPQRRGMWLQPLAMWEPLLRTSACFLLIVWHSCCSGRSPQIVWATSSTKSGSSPNCAHAVEEKPSKNTGIEHTMCSMTGAFCLGVQGVCQEGTAY